MEIIVLPTLLKALEEIELPNLSFRLSQSAHKLSQLEIVISHMAMAPIDIDLILYGSKEDNSVVLDKEKGVIKVLKEPDTLYYDRELAGKLIKIVEQYEKQDSNITLSRLEKDVLDGGFYPVHDLVCTLYALEQGKAFGYPKLNKYEISVPAIKKPFRPANTFIFYTLLDHQEYGSKAVNDFIAQWDKLNTEKKK